jgi:hypothetical protein
MFRQCTFRAGVRVKLKELRSAVTVTLNLKPELEAGLLAQVQATGLTLEDYLQQLVERELSAEAIEAGWPEGSGMVWENGLLVYRTGSPLPAHVVNDAIRRSREERAQHIFGDITWSCSSIARFSYRFSTPTISITNPAPGAFLGTNKEDFCAPHTLGEVYSTLTGLPVRPRITGPHGLAIVAQIRERLSIVSPTEQEYVSTLETASPAIVCNTAYDALIAVAPLK